VVNESYLRKSSLCVILDTSYVSRVLKSFALQIWTLFCGACNRRIGPKDIWTVCMQYGSDWLHQWAWGLCCGWDMHRTTVWSMWGSVGAWPWAWWSVWDNITGSDECLGQGPRLGLGSCCSHYVSVRVLIAGCHVSKHIYTKRCQHETLNGIHYVLTEFSNFWQRSGNTCANQHYLWRQVYTYFENIISWIVLFWVTTLHRVADDY